MFYNNTVFLILLTTNIINFWRFSYVRERGNGQMGTENIESCSQRDSAERKGYVRAHRSFNRIWKERDSAEPDLLGHL